MVHTRHAAVALLLVAAQCVLALPSKKHLARSEFPECVQREAHSQHSEDLRLLVPLLCMAAEGGPATFTELGAFTGVDLSNTVMLERCYNWTGVLIEGNPRNYHKLLKSGRTAPKVHSAVCPGDKDGTVSFALAGDDRAGEPAMRTKNIRDKLHTHGEEAVKAKTVEVTCKSLQRILAGAGFADGVSILFLDVEGAEAKVLQSMDLTKLGVVLVENTDPMRHTRDVEPLLHAAGFHRVKALEASSWNPVYVRRGGPMSERCIACADEATCRVRYW